MLPHAEEDITSGGGSGAGSGDSDTRDTETTQPLELPPAPGGTTTYKYGWTAPDPESLRLHRTAFWRFVSNNFSDAEYRVLLESECLICYQPVRRLYGTHSGHLVISTWRHEYAAKHAPAVEEEPYGRTH